MVFGPLVVLWGLRVLVLEVLVQVLELWERSGLALGGQLTGACLVEEVVVEAPCSICFLFAKVFVKVFLPLHCFPCFLSLFICRSRSNKCFQDVLLSLGVLKVSSHYSTKHYTDRTCDSHSS